MKRLANCEFDSELVTLDDRETVVAPENAIKLNTKVMKEVGVQGPESLKGIPPREKPRVILNVSREIKDDVESAKPVRKIATSMDRKVSFNSVKNECNEKRKLFVPISIKGTPTPETTENNSNNDWHDKNITTRHGELRLEQIRKDRTYYDHRKAKMERAVEIWRDRMHERVIEPLEGSLAERIKKRYSRV